VWELTFARWQEKEALAQELADAKKSMPPRRMLARAMHKH